MRTHNRRTITAVTWILLLGWLSGCNRTASPPIDSPTTSAASTPSTVAAAALALEKQQYIWEIEHTTFELEHKFGASLMAVLKKREANEFDKFLLPDVVAHVLPEGERTVLDRGFLREESSPDNAPADREVDGESLAQYLCAYFEDFQKIERAKCRVLALDADDRNPASGRWTAKVLMGGVGLDAEGARLEFVTHHRVTFRFTGDEEIVAGKIVSGWTVLSEKFRRSPATLFEEVTTAVGLDQVDIPDNWNGEVDMVRQYFTQMAIEDYDGDGRLDIAVASANGRWRLLRSMPIGEASDSAKFVDVTARVGLPVWADEEPRSRSLRDEIYLATWVDFDNDGDPDLILGDRLFRNDQGKRFKEVTEESGLVIGFNPRGCLVADFDGDGWLDLYVLYQNHRERPNDHAGGWVGDDATGAENQLWRNLGQGKFANITESANAGGGSRQSFAAAWLHANDDHFPDLYIANDFGTNVLLINQGNGTFHDMSASTGAADFATSMGVATGDLTGDGEPDIYVANMFSKMGRRIIAHVGPEDYPPGVYEQIQGSCAGNRLYTRTAGQTSYDEISETAGINQVGWAYAPALADFDGDGMLDIYATAGFLSFQRSKPDG